MSEQAIKQVTLSVVILSLVFTMLLSQATSDEVVLVEMNGGVIRAKSLTERIDTLPENQRSRYKSVEGQTQVLNVLVNEAIFLRKAKELGIDKQPAVVSQIDRTLKPVINDLYREELIDKAGRITPADVEKYYRENSKEFMILPKVTIRHLQVSTANLEAVQAELEKGTNFEELIQQYSTNEETKAKKGIISDIRMNNYIAGIGSDEGLTRAISDADLDAEKVYGPYPAGRGGFHFFQKIDYEPSSVRPFRTVQNDLTLRLTDRHSNTVVYNEIERNRPKYNIVYHSNIIDDNPQYMQLTEEQAAVVVVESNNPYIRLTRGETNIMLRQATQDRIDISVKAIRDRIIEDEISAMVLTATAVDGGALTRYESKPEVQQLKTNIILRTYYQQEIVEKVEVSEEEVSLLYMQEQGRFTIPTSRDIRQFVAKDDKSAKAHRKTIEKLLKKNQEDAIIALIKSESLAKDNDGLIEKIYQNKIVPPIGTDEEYNKKIWELGVRELSPIFRNVKNEIVFFYVVSETPASVRPFAEVEPMLQTSLHRRKENELFRETMNGLVNEYNVVVHYDRLRNLVTPEELFQMAEEAQRRYSYVEAMDIFNSIMRDFPNTQHEYRAMFMKAFITAEDLKQTDSAIQLFEEFLRKYPEGDLNESANLMLEALKSDTDIEAMIFGE